MRMSEKAWYALFAPCALRQSQAHSELHEDACTDDVLVLCTAFEGASRLGRHALREESCENILKTLFGMNDSPGSRQDVQDLNIREELWLQPARRQGDEFYMPHAPYILKPQERRQFVQIVSNIRTPTNYVGAIHKRLVDGKLQYMKTHDYHVLMQQVAHQISDTLYPRFVWQMSFWTSCSYL